MNENGLPSWPKVPLKEVATDFFSGGTPSTGRPEFWSGEIPWTTSAQINSSYLCEAAKFISRLGVENSATVIVPKGNLLIGTRVGVGKAAVNGIDVAISQDLTAAIIRQDRYDPLFLAFVLRTEELQSEFEARKRGATIKGIPRDDLLSIEVPSPSLEEQRNIARILRSVERLIQLEDRQVQGFVALKSATMAKLFREGLRGEPLKQTEIGEIPESWELTSLGQLSRENGGCIQTGPFGSQLHARDYRQEGIPVINPTHLEGNRINHTDVPRVSPDEADRLDRHRVELGDILFGRRGEIGRHGLVSGEEVGWLCGTGCFLVRVRSPRVDNAFLSYFFSTENVVKWLVSHAAGTIMPNLNNVVLSALPVVLPEIGEQREIVQILDAIDRNHALHNRRLALLEALFSTMLHALMTGAVRVKDLDLAEVSRA